MCLRYSFGLAGLADTLEAAVANVLSAGLRTADIRGEAAAIVSTAEMGDAVTTEFAGLVERAAA